MKTKKQLKMVIEYIADIDQINTEDILDRLRESGQAEIVNIFVVDPKVDTKGKQNVKD